MNEPQTSDQISGGADDGRRGRRRTSPLSLPREEIEGIVRSIATDVALFSSEWTDEKRGGGGDVDCIVRGVDPSWPLRLPSDARVCQRIEYDLNSDYWVIDRGGRVVAIDLLDDPGGDGRYGLPTDLMLSTTGHDLFPPAATRAVYLTLKRLTKGSTSQEEWLAIAELAAQDPAGYRELLTNVLGRAAMGVSDVVLGGRVPDERLSRRIQLARRKRFISAPVSVFRGYLLRADRALRRSIRPTGFLVAVVGPDGSGKSQISSALPQSCEGFFRRDLRVHWRPGVLPRPGSMVRAPEGDPSDPHGRPPRGPLTSGILLLYHWIDFSLGSLIRFYPMRIRSGLVVVERGWFDLLVDPERYRLDVPSWIVRGLGKLLPQPDLTLVLDAPPEILLKRKQELPASELARQREVWDSLSRANPRMRKLDATRPVAEVIREAREAVVTQLETRTISRLGAGWACLPRARPRWTLPRGPRRVAKGALALYQPMSPRRRIMWEAGRVLASLGASRIRRRSEAPPRAVRERVGPYIPSGGTFALSRANHPDRYLALTLDKDGSPQLLIKVALDDAGRAALSTEASRIKELSGLLDEPVRAPTVVDRSEGALVLRAEAWRPRNRAWVLDIRVAAAMGRFFSRGAADRSDGPVHGDLAPWNLLQTYDGWVLIDWERARSNGPPFYDLFHHFVQSHILLGRPRTADLFDALGERGPLAECVRAYRRAAHLELDGIVDTFLTYLETSRGDLDPRKADGRKGLQAREQLVRDIKSRR